MKIMKKPIVWIALIGTMVLGIVLAWRYYGNCKKYARLTYIGHATVKIKTVEGKVIYMDPYFPVGDYREPADYILVTHEHSDHNQISLCKQAKGCQVIRLYNALEGEEYQTFDKDGIKIEAVPSGGNANHSVSSCVGYIVTVDGVSIYHAGDTSMNEDKKLIAGKKIDYAMYPVDGTYNMGPEEASKVADLIGATHNIPIHGVLKKFYKQRKEFSAKGKLELRTGQTIFLKN